MGTLSGKTAEPPRRRMQKRAIETRSQILASATRHFARDGFEGTSTRAVAQDAGVNHALLMYHFENKERLWRAVVETAVASLRESFEASIRDDTLDDIEQLRCLCRDFIRFAAANRDFHHIMASVERVADPLREWLTEESMYPFTKIMTDLIKKAQGRGRFVRGDPMLVLHLFIDSATGLYLRAHEVSRMTGRVLDSPASIAEHIELCERMFFQDKN